MPRNAATNRFRIRNQNASIFINGTDGAAGNALSIANNASLSPTAAVTLEIRFRPTARKAAILFDNSTLGVTNSYYLSISAGGGLYWFSTIGGVAKNILGTTTKVKFDEWNMVNATYDGAAIKLFLNGSQLAETLAATGSMGTNSGPLRIGAYYSGGTSQTFQGSISQPRVYATGCTLAEHQDRYYRSITSAALQAALVLDLNTERGASSTSNDLSGLGNNATLGASASWTSDSPFKSRKASVNANLVKNGDSEYAPPFTAATTTASQYIDGSAAGSTTNDLFGWAIESNGSAGTFSAQYDSSSPYAGLCSMKVSTLAVASAASVRPIRNSSTTADILKYGIPVTPNTTYNVSFAMRTNLVSGSATSGAFLRINHFNAAGSSVTSTDSTKVQTTTGQTVYTFQLTTGTATTLLIPNMLVVGNDGAATLIMDAYFDNISITPVYPEGRVPANGNLVKNFDFEVAPTFVAAQTTRSNWIDGTAAGSSTNSTYKWALNFTNTSSSGVSCQFDTVNPNTGLVSMKVSTTATNVQACVSNITLTSLANVQAGSLRVLPSTSYSYSFWMRTNYVSGDSSDGAYIQFNERDATSATTKNTTSTKVKTTTGWTLYSGTFTTNAQSVYLDVQMFVKGNTGAATLIMDAWFDDIYLAPTTNPGRVVIT